MGGAALGKGSSGSAVPTHTQWHGETVAEDWMHGSPESLAGKAAVKSSESWLDAGIRDPRSLEHNLRTLQIRDREITDVLDERAGLVEKFANIEEQIDEIRYAGYYFMEPEEIEQLVRHRKSLLARFKNLIARRTFRVEDVTERQIELPLFLLSAPEPTGCSTSFSATDDERPRLDMARQAARHWYRRQFKHLGHLNVDVSLRRWRQEARLPSNNSPMCSGDDPLWGRRRRHDESGHSLGARTRSWPWSSLAGAECLPAGWRHY